MVWWISVLVSSLFPPCLCFNHWVVTEDGKIEHQVKDKPLGGVCNFNRGVASLCVTWLASGKTIVITSHKVVLDCLLRCLLSAPYVPFECKVASRHGLGMCDVITFFQACAVA